MPSRYPHIVRFVADQPWAILEEKLQSIVAFIEMKASGMTFSAEELQALKSAARPPTQPTGSVVAVLPLYGVISQRVNMLTEFSGGTSTEVFAGQFRQVRDDPKVQAIVLDVDSPGGGVRGIDELAAEIYAARGRKPIVAVANCLMASAAYWIASAADEVVASPSAEVGSIGIYGVHEDASQANEKEGIKYTVIRTGKFKNDANPYEPLSGEAYDGLLKRANEYHAMFTSRLAKSRRTPVADVRSGFGQGRVVGVKEALSLGMIDGIDTLESVIAQLARGKTSVLQTGTPQLTDTIETTRRAATDQEPVLQATSQELLALSRSRVTTALRIHGGA